MVVLVAERPVSVLVKNPTTEDLQTNKALDELRAEVAAVPAGVLDGAQRIKDVVLTIAAYTRVKHNLKRPPVGYIWRSRSVPSAVYTVYDDNDNRTDADKFLYLRSLGADVTVDLVIY